MEQKSAQAREDALAHRHQASLVRYFLMSGHAIDRRIRQEFKANRIRLFVSHTVILPVIELAGTRPTEVARRTGLSKQALTRPIRELEKAGYLSRIIDPTDRRAWLLMFTPSGRRLLERIHRAV